MQWKMGPSQFPDFKWQRSFSFVKLCPRDNVGMPRSGSMIPTFFLGQRRSSGCSFQSSLFQEKTRVIQKSIEVIYWLLSELNPTSYSDPRLCCIDSLFFLWLHFLFFLLSSPQSFPTPLPLLCPGLQAVFQPCLTYSCLRTFAVATAFI